MPLRNPAATNAGSQKATPTCLVIKGELHSLWQFASCDVDTRLLEFHWVGLIPDTGDVTLLHRGCISAGAEGKVSALRLRHQDTARCTYSF